MSTITGLVPLTDIDGPAYKPSANSLLATVQLRDDPSLRWAAGAMFRSNAGEATMVGGEVVTDGCAPWAKTPDMHDQWLDAWLLVLYGWWQCSPVGYTPDEAQARARQLFANAEAAALESKLWTQLTAACQATATPPEALALAEQQIGVDYGGEGIIHTNRYSATNVAFYLNRSGSSLRTIGCNTPLVVGDGYPAATGTAEFVGTGPMTVIRGPITDLTDPTNGSGLNRAVNDLNAVVERAYLVLTDSPQGACFSAPVASTP
jgi:hypothetical protein